MKQPTPWTMKTVRDRCKIDPATDCWEWRQCLNADGHPQANIMGQHWLVRRWVLHCEGRLIPRMPVTSPGCESTCCNPQHLRHETKGTILKRAYADGRRDRHGEAVRKRQRRVELGITTVDHYFDTLGGISSNRRTGRHPSTTINGFPSQRLLGSRRWSRV